MPRHTNTEADIPSPFDLREPVDAAEWAANAESARPGRPELRALIADELASLPAGARVLELGAGPGFLAEEVLARCANVARYSLLDFSQPMLAMSCERLRSFGERAEFLLADFKSHDWNSALPMYDAVVSMQAVHETRHKHHAPELYRQIQAVLNASGRLWVIDHSPKDDSPHMTTLFMTAAEQHVALTSAGFVDVRTLLMIERLYLVHGRKA